MPIPNADRAIIAVEKLTAYLLNPSHKRAGAKARLLLSLGYRTDAPDVLESDLRAQHLSFKGLADVADALRCRLRDRRADYDAERNDRAFLLNLAD